MSCRAEYQKNYDAPVVAGNLRILLGLLLVFAGLYVAAISNLPGNGLGFLLVFASPFVMLKDNKC